MAQNTLPDNVMVEWRRMGILESDEIAVSEGDLIVAVNVVTGGRRLLKDRPAGAPVRESASNKRLLKG